MATRKTAKQKRQGAVAAGLGAAAVAAAAAGAGYYFYAGKNAKKHRQAASRWAKGMKRAVVKRAKDLKKIDASAIADAVDEAVSMYEGVRGVTPADLRSAARELKREWRQIKGEVTGTARKTAARAKGTVKRAAKKAAPKKRSAKKKA